MEKAFITGCDENTQWMLPWFLKNYQANTIVPLFFVDFGVTKECRDWLEHEEAVYKVIEIEPHSKKNWYLKPEAIMRVEVHKRFWIDTDCEIVGDITDIFSYLEPNKLAMVQDIPWTKRRGGLWFNTGVVGVMNKPKVLEEWYFRCKKATSTAPLYGDQDIFHEMFPSDIVKQTMVTSLPNKYNYLRLQFQDGDDVPDKKIIHWTGQKGKLEIQNKMR